MNIFICIGLSVQKVILFNESETVGKKNHSNCDGFNRVVFENKNISDLSSFLISTLLKINKHMPVVKKIILSCGPASFTNLRVADIFLKSIQLKYSDIDILRVSYFEQMEIYMKFYFNNKKSIKDSAMVFITNRNLYLSSLGSEPMIVESIPCNSKVVIFEDHYEKVKDSLVEKEIHVISQSDHIDLILWIFKNTDKISIKNDIAYYA